MHRWDLLTDRHQLKVTWAGNVTGVGALKYVSRLDSSYLLLRRFKAG